MIPNQSTFSLASATITGPDGVTVDAPATGVAGLTINPDGSWSFDPSDDAYNSLAAGETQVINVTYQVADSGGLTDTNSFSITVTGTNDDPKLTETAATLDNATEDQAKAGTPYTISKADLLQGFTDADTGDVLVVKGLTAYAA